MRPDVVIGGGGFASGPVVALAALRGVPALALEADAHLGVANRMLRPFVRRRLPELPHRRAGAAQVRAHRAAAGPAQRQASADEGREVFELRADLPVVLAFGGSQGAQSINRACVDAFGGA